MWKIKQFPWNFHALVMRLGDSYSTFAQSCTDVISFYRQFVQVCCRSPHGERGLKYALQMTEER